MFKEILKVSPAAIGNRNGFRTVGDPQSGENAEGDDDGVAADDGGGEGTTVGCTTVVESVAEGCATVEPLVFFLATFCASLVAAVGLSLTAGADVSFEVAASFLRASLASL